MRSLKLSKGSLKRPSWTSQATALMFGLVLAPLAMAQQAPSASLGRVEVTGSNIKQASTEGATPVLSLSREDIEKSGKSSIAELLQSLSVDNQGSVPTSFGNGFAAGASGISLRGLGAASTLVLVNGRRVAPYGLADDGQKVFVDLNMIPMEAVDRVEIVKDGASAIYGSDAIAGVVNIILRKNFEGSVAKVGLGTSRYGDGTEARVALTHGFGNLEKDGFNAILNFESTKSGAVWYGDRTDRAQVGRNDLRDFGCDANSCGGGTGAIVLGLGGGTSINGSVRQPGTAADYYQRGNTNAAVTGFTKAWTLPIGSTGKNPADCSNFTSHVQGDPDGGCLIDGAQAYGQAQPSQTTNNFFGRFTKQLAANSLAYAELNLYQGKSVSSSSPSAISSSVGYPGGPVSNSSVSLSAAHPDNPYSAAARFRYLAADVGPRVSNTTSDFNRILVGLKGDIGAWDYDTSAMFSQNKVTNVRTGYLQRDVTFALLNPGGANSRFAGLTNAQVATRDSAAYAALPAGTLWRIAENAGLNSAAMYAALSPSLSGEALSQTTQIDFKASTEVGQLPGGPVSLALGGEIRSESIKLAPTPGTDKGNIIGLGYSAYDGSRTVTAGFTELLAPITKEIELSAAARFDAYSDVGNSVTPRVGVKWSPAKEFAIRSTFSKGFRAPSAAEAGKGGLAAFSSSDDPVRCALGISSACNAGTVAVITSPNANLKPETSTSFNIGVLWDPTPKTNISFDLWQIQRENEINQEATSSAVAAGQVVRDLSSAGSTVGDPGPIIAVLSNYVNSAKSKVNGFDLDASHTIDLSAKSKLGLDAKWTHLMTWMRTEQDGTEMDYVGTHGNCDATNCMGTPADRVSLGITWTTGDLKIATNITYRGPLDSINFKGEEGCANHFADGSDAPAGCKVKSFTTVDVGFRYKLDPKIEIFGAVQNVLDAVPPIDVMTYGAAGYNPLDYSGALGRYFKIGAKVNF